MAGDIVFNPLLMATPTGGPSFDRFPLYFNGRTEVAVGIIDQSWDASTGSGAMRLSSNHLIKDYDSSPNEPWVMWASRAYLRKVRCRIFQNSFNKPFDLFMLKNEQKYGQLQFTVDAGETGDFANPIEGSQFLVLNQGDRYAWGLFTDDDLVPTGTINMICSSEIYFGDGLY